MEGREREVKEIVNQMEDCIIWELTPEEEQTVKGIIYGADYGSQVHAKNGTNSGRQNSM